MKLFALLLLLLPSAGLANDWNALKTEGAIAIMRHAIAPGTGDPDNFALGDCSTQRNLNEDGRAQARALGAALREQGIAFDAVLTSQWCRARETADLLDLGPVTEAPALNSFFEDRANRDRQTRAARDLIAATEGRLMLVTHQVNITALVGQSTRSGEVLIIRPDADGFEVLGRIMMAP